MKKKWVNASKMPVDEWAALEGPTEVRISVKHDKNTDSYILVNLFKQNYRRSFRLRSGMLIQLGGSNTEGLSEPNSLFRIDKIYKAGFVNPFPIVSMSVYPDSVVLCRLTPEHELREFMTILTSIKLLKNNVFTDESLYIH